MRHIKFLPQGPALTSKAGFKPTTQGKHSKGARGKTLHTHNYRFTRVSHLRLCHHLTSTFLALFSSSIPPAPAIHESLALQERKQGKKHDVYGYWPSPQVLRCSQVYKSDCTLKAATLNLIMRALHRIANQLCNLIKSAGAARPYAQQKYRQRSISPDEFADISNQTPS